MDASEVSLSIVRNGVVEATLRINGPTKLGRQRNQDEPLYRKVPQGNSTADQPAASRIAIASLADVTISRDHVLLEPLNAFSFRVTNISAHSHVHVEDQLLDNQQVRVVGYPASIVVGDRIISVEHRSAARSPPRMTGQTILPGATVRISRPQGSVLRDLQDVAESEVGAFTEWLHSVMNVLQAATGADDYYERAVDAMLNLVGLDTATVVLFKGADFELKCQKSSRGQVSADWKPSRRMLQKVRREKCSVSEIGDASGDTESSLTNVAKLIAAPILDRDGNVIGALYGDRATRMASAGQDTSALEARGVETLATAVAVGLARDEQEVEALKARSRFEEYFTKELAEYLATAPDVLTGREADVTVLSCDIRGFSTICHKFGAEQTFRLIRDVMDVLSECVRRHDGVIVDYVGDELMAMWGAPQAQPDHADRACRAAVDMIRCLPERTAGWQTELGEPVQVRIGASSGLAWVGNTGSKWRFKYGPLGTPVNLASRVQGATKFLHTDVCVSEFTRSRITRPSDFNFRRLGKVRVVNIPEPFALYELKPDIDEGWTYLVEHYESALELFEAGHFPVAAKDLGRILHQSAFDGPTLSLLSRAVYFWEHPPVSFDGVWDLPGK